MIRYQIISGPLWKVSDPLPEILSGQFLLAESFFSFLTLFCSLLFLKMEFPPRKVVILLSFLRTTICKGCGQNFEKSKNFETIGYLIYLTQIWTCQIFPLMNFWKLSYALDILKSRYKTSLFITYSHSLPYLHGHIACG